MNRLALVTFLGGAVLSSGCAYSNVSVTPSGAAVHAERRPPDCQIEFFRTKAPERAYDEIATVHLTRGSAGMTTPSAEATQEAMRRAACSLGADAVIVTRDYLAGFMTGTAVAYRK